jgi:DNA (cytosine-5)-methyltransferase 3A
MANAIRESITKTFGFEPICINSALVSAQNRQRLYWVGKRNEDGTYSRVPVEQPEDRGILLRDILDQGTDLTGNDKSYCLTASYDGACAWNPLERKQRSMVCEPVGIGYRGRMDNGKWKKRYESNGEPKANALTTAQTDSMVAQHIRVGALPRPNGELSTSQAFRVYSADGKSVNITAGGGGAGGKTGLYAIPVEFDGETPIKAISAADGKTYPVYEVKDRYITIKGKSYPIKLVDGFYIIRKLTVRECMRLQTVPEWYEFPVSDSQAYKMLGNGWTVSVISHLILSALKNNP